MGILFFGFLGLMVALVPFLDRGAAAGPSAADAEFLCRLDGGVRYFHDRAEHDGEAPAGSTRQGPARRCRQRRGNPREGDSMKKLLFFLVPALLLVWTVLPGSADVKKRCPPAEKAPAPSQSPPAPARRCGCGKNQTG